MSLEEQLAGIRKMAGERIPPAALALMHQGTDALRNSGILDSVIKVGATLPPFALPNQHGDIVQSKDLLARGAVVLTVFRGHW